MIIRIDDVEQKGSLEAALQDFRRGSQKVLSIEIEKRRFTIVRQSNEIFQEMWDGPNMVGAMSNYGEAFRLAREFSEGKDASFYDDDCPLCRAMREGKL